MGVVTILSYILGENQQDLEQRKLPDIIFFAFAFTFAIFITIFMVSGLQIHWYSITLIHHWTLVHWCNTVILYIRVYYPVVLMETLLHHIQPFLYLFIYHSSLSLLWLWVESQLTFVSKYEHCSFNTFSLSLSLKGGLELKRTLSILC